MIAYFALLSFVPLTFLALAALGFAGRADESSFLVTEIQHALPDAPVGDIVALVRQVQDNAATLGIVGGAFLLWTSLSLFSVLESAFNIVYGRPNRSFLHGKAVASILMLGSRGTLFVAPLVGSLGVALRVPTPDAVDNVSRYLQPCGPVDRRLVSSSSVYTGSRTRSPSRRAVWCSARRLCRGRRGAPANVRYNDLNPALKTFSRRRSCSCGSRDGEVLVSARSSTGGLSQRRCIA